MASLQCGSFHVALNDHFGWMTCHIWNRQMAFFWGSSHVSLNHHFDKISCDIWSRQMASLLCGSFHVSSNHHSDWRIPVTFVIWSRQMASTLIKIDHIPLLWYAVHRTPKTCFLRRYRHHALRNLTCACLYCLLLCYCSLPKKVLPSSAWKKFLLLVFFVMHFNLLLVYNLYFHPANN